MKIKYYGDKVLRYFIIVGGTYELSTDSLETVVKVIKNIPIEEIMLLDTVERKWVDVGILLKK